MSPPDDEWNRAEAPVDGAIVRVLASDDHGEYAIPFPVIFRCDEWFNIATGEELADEVFVEGWRPWAAHDRAEESRSVNFGPSWPGG